MVGRIRILLREDVNYFCLLKGSKSVDVSDENSIYKICRGGCLARKKGLKNIEVI